MLKFNIAEWDAVVREMSLNGQTEIIEIDTGTKVLMKIEGIVEKERERLT